MDIYQLLFILFSSFVLKQKKQKFKDLTSYATKCKLRLKDLNSLCSNIKSFLTPQLIFCLTQRSLRPWLHSLLRTPISDTHFGSMSVVTPSPLERAGERTKKCVHTIILHRGCKCALYSITILKSIREVFIPFMNIY